MAQSKHKLEELDNKRSEAIAKIQRQSAFLANADPLYYSRNIAVAINLEEEAHQAVIKDLASEGRVDDILLYYSTYCNYHSSQPEEKKLQRIIAEEQAQLYQSMEKNKMIKGAHYVRENMPAIKNEVEKRVLKIQAGQGRIEDILYYAKKCKESQQPLGFSNSKDKPRFDVK